MVGGADGSLWWSRAVENWDDAHGIVMTLPIGQYVKATKIVKCPAEMGRVRMNKQPFFGNYYYVWNYTVNVGAIIGTEGKIDLIRNPSKMPIWVEENTDADFRPISANEANTINDMAFAGSDITSARHGGFAHMGFADGHVARLEGGLRQDSARWPEGPFIFRQH